MISLKPEDVAKRIREHVTPEILRRGMVRAAYRGQALLRKKTPADQGQMKNSWEVREWAREIELINTAPYAGIVEAGARPHPVSVEGQMAIYWWVVRHRKFFNELRTAKGNAVRLRHRRAQGPVKAGGSAPMSELDPRVSSIVWAITKKIREKGQRPTYFVKNCLPELGRFVEQEVDRAIREHNREVG